MAEDSSQHPQYPRGPKYDEQRALQRLEQLRRDIQAARWRREQAVAEFDKFVAGFRESPGLRPVTPPPVPPAGAMVHETGEPVPPAEVSRADQPSCASPPLTAPTPVTATTPATAMAPTAGPPSTAAPSLAIEEEPESTAPPVAPSAQPIPDPTPAASPVSETGATTFEPLPPLALPSPKRRSATASLPRVAALAGGLIAAAIGGFLWLRPGTSDSTRFVDPTPRPAQAATAAATRPSAPSRPEPAPAQPAGAAPSDRGTPDAAPSTEAAPPQPTAAPPPPGVLRLELTARETVWIRVTVDGRRVIEREVPAGFRRVIDAERAVAIRAGNAAALLVGENGAAPVPMGREGQALTRIFPSPAR